MTNQHDIAEWFDEGTREGALHMIVVCDEFDHEDYPVFIDETQEFWVEYAKYNGVSMQRVMEVYDLKADKQSQLDEPRANHAPKRKST